MLVVLGCNLPAVGFRSTHELMLNILKDVELDYDTCFMLSEVRMKRNVRCTELVTRYTIVSTVISGLMGQIYSRHVHF